MGFLDMFKKKGSAAAIQNMLSMLGVKMEDIIPQVSTKLAEWLRSMEAKAGAKLLLIATVDDDENIIIQLHKVQDNVTEHWQTFNLNDFQNILNSIENDTTIIDDQPTTTEPATTTTTGTDTAEPEDTDTGTDTASE